MPGETIRAFTPVPGPGAGEVDEGDALGLGLRAGRGAVVPGDHLGAAGPQRGDGGQAGAAEAEDGDLVAGIAADGDHGATGVRKAGVAHAQFRVSP